MKNLYLLRGAPACGKSTWIKQNKLETFTLSSDKIRLLFPFATDEKGKIVITQAYDNKVWALLYNLMEDRMKLGQPIIIDATHYRGDLIKGYKEYINKYKYTIKIIDFMSDISLSELKQRNSKRLDLQVVPDYVIERMYKTIQENTKELKKQYIFISPEEGLSEFQKELKDYTKITPISREDLDDLIGNLKGLSLNKDKCTDKFLEEVFNEACKLFPVLEIEKNYDQKNKYHNLNLDKHTLKVIENLPFYPNEEILYLGALFHDIGKPAVAFDGKDGYQHFIGHPHYGALLTKSRVIPILHDKYSQKDLDFLIYLVEHHDDLVNENFIANQKEKGLTDSQIEMLLQLEIADAKAHIIDSIIDRRIQICEKELENVLNNR